VSRWTYDSRRYRKALREIQATGPCCVICGHPGSDSIHHRLPASLFPDLASDPANWAPSHGVRGCPVCGRRCNQEQGSSLKAKRSPRSRRW
jgi:5-methylcytosine-specific restriction endonuclease McrA